MKTATFSFMLRTTGLSATHGATGPTIPIGKTGFPKWSCFDGSTIRKPATTLPTRLWLSETSARRRVEWMDHVSGGSKACAGSRGVAELELSHPGCLRRRYMSAHTAIISYGYYELRVTEATCGTPLEWTVTAG